MLAEIQRKKFTTDEYHQLIETGLLKEGDRVELLEGEIINMAAMGSFHAGCVNRLTHLFTKAFSGEAIISVQNPISISKYSEPEPDFALLRPREDFYTESHPRPEDIYLIVEISVSSLEYDRGFKLPLYARAGIKEAWVVNLDESCVEVYTKPSEHEYDMMEKFRRGDVVKLRMFPDNALDVKDIVG